MDFSLSESQSVLKASVDGFLRERFAIEQLQALAVAAEVPDLWPEMAELGWCGLLIPEMDGGSGGDLFDAALILESLGYAALPSPFAHSAVVGTELVLRFGKAGQRVRWLPRLAKGELRLALALSEENGEFSSGSIRASGAPGKPLSGRKLFVKDADQAEFLITAVRRESEPWLVAVPREIVRLEPMETLSGERLFMVDLTNAVLDETFWFSDRCAGQAGVHNAISLGAMSRSAELVGLAQRVLDICIEHISVREQSGQPIGAFQALQHSAADMLRDVEGARGIVWRAAWGLANGDSASTDVAMAKAYSSDACLNVVRRGHQLIGAIGYCEEHPLHILHKRIQAASLDFGDANWHLDHVADSLGLVSAA